MDLAKSIYPKLSNFMKTKYRLPKLLMFLSLFTLSFIPYLSTKAFSKTVYSFFGDKGTYLASYGNPDLNSQYRLIGNFAGGQYDVYDDLLFGNFIELNPGSSNPYYVVRFKLFTGNGSAFTGGVDLPGQFQPADYKTANINVDR